MLDDHEDYNEEGNTIVAKSTPPEPKARFTLDARPANRRHLRHRRSKSYWIPILALLIGIEAVPLLALHARLSIAKKDKALLVRSLQDGAVEKQNLRSRESKLRDEIAGQVHSRLPALRPMEFDRVIPIEEGPLKNVMFTESGPGEHKISEYRIVLSNPTSSALRLHLEILLFNQAGIQFGRARVGGDRDTPAWVNLDPGETRSYSDKLDWGEQNLLPSYFMLRYFPQPR